MDGVLLFARSAMGLGATDRVAGMGRSHWNRCCEHSSRGGILAASRRRISLFCLGDGLADAADLLGEG